MLKAADDFIEEAPFDVTEDEALDFSANELELEGPMDVLPMDSFEDFGFDDFEPDDFPL